MLSPYILYRSKQRKGIFYFSQKTCYSKHTKTEKNPQVVKHVVMHDFHGDGYLPFPLCGASAGRRRAVNFRTISNYRLRSLLACKERSDGIASLSSVSHGNPRVPRNTSPKQKNNGQSIDYPLFLVEATGLEPTTFWSLRHNRKFFIYFPSISKSFVSATNALLYSCSHCFHVVQIRKWSNMWSFRLHVKNGCKKSKTIYPCTYSFVCR